jgi:hypothetical protein
MKARTHYFDLLPYSTRRHRLRLTLMPHRGVSMPIYTARIMRSTRRDTGAFLDVAALRTPETKPGSASCITFFPAKVTGTMRGVKSRRAVSSYQRLEDTCYLYLQSRRVT